MVKSYCFSSFQSKFYNERSLKQFLKVLAVFKGTVSPGSHTVLDKRDSIVLAAILWSDKKYWVLIVGFRMEEA